MYRSVPYLLSLLVLYISFAEARPGSWYYPWRFQPGSNSVQTTTAVSTGNTTSIRDAFSTDDGAPANTPNTITARSMPGKPVFVHYMVGGMMEEHVEQDIIHAKALDIDAFALNFDQFAYWSNDTVDFAFKYAKMHDFKLFFSFDMSEGRFASPAQYADYLKTYIASPAYFSYKGVPLVTTFAGSSVSNADWQSFKDDLGTPIILMPSFYDVTPTSTFFTDRPALDGTFNWNSWPPASSGQVPVSTTDDKTYLSAARASDKLFMMGMSPLQYKHMSTDWNWYARGEQNLEIRMGQVLDLQPDMLELQSWNDAGESHYMGTIWPEWIINPQTNPITRYTEALPHNGYWQVLHSFVRAWKRGETTTANMMPTNGKSVQGVFWHHPLLAHADCRSDIFAQVGNHNLVQDLVTGVILVAEGQTGLTATVTSGKKQLGTATLVSGFNKFSFDGLTTGSVSVKVTDESGNTVVSGTGPVEVVNWSLVCNYNFQVVPLS